MAIHDKLDKIISEVAEIKVISAVNTTQLKEHMRRTDLLETRVEQVASSISPIQSHVDMLKGIVKFISIISLICGIIGVVVKLWRF